MRRGRFVSTGMLALGVLLWAAAPMGPAYRTVLMLATLSGFGYVAGSETKLTH